MIEELEGLWEGEGVNHDDEPIQTILELNPAAGGAGLTLAFRALSEDGTVYYRLRGILANDRLAFLDNNIGELKILDRVQSPGGYTFGTGDPEDEESYRLELSFDLVGEGEMNLCFAWGLPGEEFLPRSCGRLTRSA